MLRVLKSQKVTCDAFSIPSIETADMERAIAEVHADIFRGQNHHTDLLPDDLEDMFLWTMVKCLQISPEAALNDLRGVARRERLSESGTYIGWRLARPHTRTLSVTRTTVCFFQFMDRYFAIGEPGEPVDVFWLCLVPHDKPGEYLRTLERIEREIVQHRAIITLFPGHSLMYLTTGSEVATLPRCIRSSRGSRYTKSRRGIAAIWLNRMARRTSGPANSFHSFSQKVMSSWVFRPTGLGRRQTLEVGRNRRLRAC